MDWIFQFVLEKKIPCNDIINGSDTQLIKNSQNYLEGCYIQVNDADFADAELISKKKSNNLKKILIIESGMETDLLLSNYKGTPKTGGFVQIGKTFRSSYSIEGGIDKLDLSDPDIQRFIDIENPNLEYLSNAVSHRYNGRPAECIKAGFKVIEGKTNLSNYRKYSCLRNIFSHDGPKYYLSTVKDFDYYFGQNGTFDLKQYDVNNQIIIIDLEPAKTRAALDILAGDLIQDAKSVWNL